MHTPNAIVIGSGVAGMAVAIRLASQGYTVTVYEKNSYPGGKISLVEKNGYRFDGGPSLFTEPSNIEELFEVAGEPIENYFTYEKTDCSCKYFFTNGKVVHTWNDREALVKEFVEKLGEDGAAVEQYLDQAKQLYETTGSIFLQHSLQTFSTWRRKGVMKALLGTKPGLLFNTLNEYNQTHFKTREATQIFNRFATYNGSDPYKAPAMLSVIAHIELNGGIYYPHGGMISITNALYKLAQKKGVVFKLNTPVERIIYAGSEVKGIVVNKENVFADVVVSNIDIYDTYKYLLSNPHKATAVAKKEKSSSAIVFYWGIKKNLPQVKLHNIFFSNEYEKEFRHIFKEHSVFADPTIYLNVTSKMEPGHAPEGKENWFVMVNAPANNGQDWPTLITYVRQQVLKKLRGMLKEDIEPLIETEEVLDPVTMEQNTGAYAGAIYGTSSNTKKTAFIRHPNFSKDIDGMYFCGGTVHPGGGIPLCLKSAEIVATLAATYHKASH